MRVGDALARPAVAMITRVEAVLTEGGRAPQLMMFSMPRLDLR